MDGIQSVQKHYDTHLGAVYSWTMGDLDSAFLRSNDFLTSLDLPVADGQLAVDLGCGFGLHAIPLAQRGYHVLAIDFCTELLSDLRARARELPVTIVEADLMTFDWNLPESPNLILCLGDTLTHLPNLQSVDEVIEKASAKLAPGGRIVLGFRDYVGTELIGTDRFIPVRTSDDRIFTCFLEYAPGHITVHDLVHERTTAGWKQKISAYRKLRLDRNSVAAELMRQGLRIVRNELKNGLVTLAGLKET
jgi:SAM-dependent methyltransferase